MSSDSGTSNVGTAARAASLILITLASAQFLMTLDTSVMNVSIATVAKDVGTTVTGIQTAITLYTLVMAAFMITGGKIGQIIGRKRAFMIGAVIYGCGSLTTAVAPSLPVLLFGWSLLEGLGAVSSCRQSSRWWRPISPGMPVRRRTGSWLRQVRSPLRPVRSSVASSRRTRLGVGCSRARSSSSW